MPRPRPDLTGQTFGRLVVRRPAAPGTAGRAFWECDCSCGRLGVRVDAQQLKHAGTRSCGCLRVGCMTEDLAGQTFERLTARRVIGWTGRRQAIWECDCSCGRTGVKVRASEMKQRKTKSCGCLGAESRVIDLAGRKFGRLTVKRMAESPHRQCGDRNAHWECECTCGRMVVVKRGRGLKKDRVKSCGCLIADRRIGDITGRVFGRLTVRRSAGNDRRGFAIWECDCDCGRTGVVIVASHLKRKLVQSCGCFATEVSRRKMLDFNSYRAEVELAKIVSELQQRGEKP